MRKMHVRRLFSKIVFEGDCWRWTGAVDSYGYGCIKIDNRKRGTHRVMYELTRGSIPAGLQVDHLCRNRWCICPDHLELVTRKENILRGESPAARNARSTHCVAGHEWSPDNTASRAGGRLCRSCKSKVNAETYQRSKVRKAVNA